MQRIFLFLFLAVFSGVIAARDSGPFLVDCKVLSTIVGIDHLSMFERIAGSYQLDKKKLKLRSVSKYGWPHVVIPAYNYDAVQKFTKPFEGIRFSDKHNHAQVSVYSKNYLAMRQELSKVISAEVDKIYREKTLFSLLDSSLGVYIDASNFCAGIPEKSVGMFMASVVLPIHGRLTHVYRLTNPEGLLLVAAMGERTMVKFIFPSTKDIDTLDYVQVHAPESVIIEIFSALKKN